MLDEEENLDIREMLRNLPKAKASPDFEDRLFKKIAEFESEAEALRSKKSSESKEGFLKKIFGERRSTWLIPALGFTAVIFFVFYITLFNDKDSVNIKETANVKTEDKAGENSLTEQKPPPVTPQSLITESTKDSNKEEPKEKVNGRNLNSENKNRPSIEKGNTDIALATEPSYAVKTGIENKKENKLKEEPDADKKDEVYNEGGVLEKQKDIAPKSENEKESLMTRTNKQENFEKQISKSILDKLNAVNKENLEKIRDKLSDN